MQKTILITGSSTGIGAETAKFLSQNNELIVHYNSSKVQAEQVANEVESNGGKAHLIQADLSTNKGCLKLVEYATQNLNRLDILVNNAGGLIRRHLADELQWELMEKIFALNVYSTMTISSLCVPLLKKSKQPCVINLTSIAMRHGAPTATIYGSAKAAIDSFTRGFAKELAPDIRVNAIAPGVIETPFHEKVSSP